MRDEVALAATTRRARAFGDEIAETAARVDALAARIDALAAQTRPQARDALGTAPLVAERTRWRASPLERAIYAA